MKKYIFNPLRNWRTWTLAALAGVAFFAICCEAETAALFVAAKAFGALTAAVCYKFARYWDAKGLLQELAEILDE